MHRPPFLPAILAFAWPCIATAQPTPPLAPTTPAATTAPGEQPLSNDRDTKGDALKDTIDVTVAGDPPDGDAASRVRYSRPELSLRPRLRPGDIVEAVPGVFAVQHAGGGKANQFFLRGFDADHGTDIRLSVDGVPVNMVSHGHGQGFADLHFLIPELVVGLEGTKGPYYAPLGDFATAGAVDMKLADTFEESYAQASMGQYGIYRGLVIESPRLEESWRAIAAAEVYADDGPFLNPEALLRFNLYGKLTHDLSDRVKGYLSWMSYGSNWSGSGQIPARAVCGEGEPGNPKPEEFGAKCIDHFGNVDPSEGGSTQRHGGSIGLEGQWEDTRLVAMAYVTGYRFQLYSNFTLFADDPVRGDGIEQDDDRVLGGADIKVSHVDTIARSTFTTTFGAQVRVDGIDNALYHHASRERLESRVQADILESSIGAYVEEDARLTKWLRFVLGLRADRFDVTVDDRLEPTNDLGTKTSGDAGAFLLSPKATATISPAKWLDLFLDYGRGFHSNDARGAVRGTDPATLLAPVTGYEVGVGVKPVKGLAFSAAGFLIDVDSEIVWVGDEGRTEASGASRRYGLELTGRYQIGNWFFADLESTIVDARYRTNAGNGDAVALAPNFTFTAGIGFRKSFGDWTPFAALRLKAITDRPATEDGSLTAEGFAIVDANAGLRWKLLELGVDVQNLFDATWREVNFATDSRMPYEPETVSGINYSPGWPFTAIGRATVYWR
ncbi:MAG: TonB-dependent receptor [Polyangiaceae bacterium]